MSTRIGSDLITRELATPDHPPDIAVDDAGVAVVVRAALLTLAPQFSDWAIRPEAAEAAVNATGQLAVRHGIAISANDPDPRGQLAELAAEISERPLHAWVVSSNVGSIRVLEKCGFGEIERRAEQDEHAGG